MPTSKIVRKYVPENSIVRNLVLVKFFLGVFSCFCSYAQKGVTKLDTLYNRILALCKKKDISGSKLCLELGLSKSVLSDIKSGRKKGISITTAQKIASYFGVSVGYLLGEETAKEVNAYDGFSARKKALVEFVKTVPDDKAEMILRVVQSIVNSEN